MMRTLLRRVGLLPGLVLFLLALGTTRSAQASHLLGGEMTYRYLDANGPAGNTQRYEITVSTYVTCTGTTITPQALIYIYDQSGTRLILNAANIGTGVTNTTITTATSLTPFLAGGLYVAPPVNSACLTPYIPVGCAASYTQSYVLQTFVTTVNLPQSSSNFYAVTTFNARNIGIANITGGDLSLYVTLAPPVYANHSPVFPDPAVLLICANDTTYLLSNAVDADGDQLVYSFGTPYNVGYITLPTFTPPLPSVTYNGGYSSTAPLGPAPNYASINPTTGLGKYKSSSAGAQYVVAVDVKEYRTINGNQVLLGTTRRDIQLVVNVCPATVAPVLPTVGTGTPGSGIPRNYTVEAGATLTIPLTATQVAGNPLSLTGSGILLDGPGGYDATFGGNTGTVVAPYPSGSAVVTGTSGTVTTSFVFNPTCAQVRAQPYDLNLKLVDLACGGKTSYDVIRITVVKPSGPTAISGDDNICGLNTVHSYSSTGGTAPNVIWSVTGGVLVTSNTNNPVQVQWTTAGTGTITATGVGAGGCVTSSITKTVTISPTPAVGVAGVQAICQGASTSLSFTGSSSYTITGGATTLTGAGPFTFTPTQTTLYTVTGATPATGCPPISQFTITVLAAPTANAGPAVTTCSGTSVSIGSAPVAGYTYSWTPTTGLSNPNIANPTVTLTNTTGAPTTQTYTLTALNANFCPATSSVVVTVNPRPDVFTVTGPRTLCGTATTATYTIATPPVNATYVWTVTGGTITAGQGTASITVSYPASAATASVSVTATSAQGCVGTPVSFNVTTDFAQAPQLVSASVDPTDNTKIVLTLAVPTPGSTTNSVQILRRPGGSPASTAYTPLGTVALGTTTYTDTPVNAATNSYEYSLSRTNGCGDALTAPAAATTILLNARLATQTANTTLTWNAYQGFTVAGYYLYRSDDGRPYTLVATLPAGTLTYLSTNTGQAFNQCWRVVAFTTTNPTPALTANSNTACVDIERGTTVMNVVTPNGDGKNDKLYIRNASLYPGNKVTVYNRWGREVFSTTSYNNDTNAWGADDNVMPGTYYYLVQLPDGTSTRGWVEVVK